MIKSNEGSDEKTKPVFFCGPFWQNPVLFAIAADAARYNYWIPGNRDYVYGVFNPYDGVGTPFFGGYYGPAGDDDWRPFPFGRQARPGIQI